MRIQVSVAIRKCGCAADAREADRPCELEVSLAEEALLKEGIQKIFGLVFKDNEAANVFWE